MCNLLELFKNVRSQWMLPIDVMLKLIYYNESTPVQVFEVLIYLVYFIFVVLIQQHLFISCRLLDLIVS